MSCELGAHRDFGGFAIADFANKNDIGLPKERTKSGSECHSDGFIGRDLVTAGQLIFHRIIYGDHRYVPETRSGEWRRRALPISLIL